MLQVFKKLTGIYIKTDKSLVFVEKKDIAYLIEKISELIDIQAVNMHRISPLVTI